MEETFLDRALGYLVDYVSNGKAYLYVAGVKSKVLRATSISPGGIYPNGAYEFQFECHCKDGGIGTAIIPFGGKYPDSDTQVTIADWLSSVFLEV